LQLLLAGFTSWLTLAWPSRRQVSARIALPRMRLDQGVEEMPGGLEVEEEANPARGDEAALVGIEEVALLAAGARTTPLEARCRPNSLHQKQRNPNCYTKEQPASSGLSGLRDCPTIGLTLHPWI